MRKKTIPVIMIVAIAVVVLYLFPRRTFPSKVGTLETTERIKEETNSQPLLYKMSSGISPNGFYLLESFIGDYYDRYNYYQIFLTDLRTGKRNKIYSGSFRTSGWKWTENNRIEITHNCGTGCRATKVIGVNETLTMPDKEEGLISKEDGWKKEE